MFRNTLKALHQCHGCIEEEIENYPEEEEARKELIRLCGEIAEDLEDVLLHDPEYKKVI